VPLPTLPGVRIEEARELAQQLMAAHGLVGWTLVLDGARTRAGVCRPARRQIGLSRVLTALHSREEVTETVLHEVAHALAGVEHGHDAVWRATAVSIGASGARCVDAAAPRPPAPWVGTCPSGHTAERHRRPQRPVSCGRCSRRFDPSALLEWRHHGQAAAMTERYLAELAALRPVVGRPPVTSAAAP
jgi:predicted SprT family Zn-dependent metalloprotease